MLTGLPLQTQYVLGFMFSEDKSQVLLIEKTKPAFMKGKLNGIGGKIEPSDKNPKEAMIREFREETGIETDGEDWEVYLEFQNETFIVFVFKAFSDKLITARNITEEQVSSHSPGLVILQDSFYKYKQPIMKNLSWLIPMALDPMICGGAVYFNDEEP